VSHDRDDQSKGRRSYRIAGLNERAYPPSPAAIGHVDDLVAGYALGALEAEEAAAVDAHVRGCAACQQALAEAERTAGMLPFLVTMHTPPADAKVALFARIAHARKAAAASALPQPAMAAWRTPTLPSSAGVDLAPVAAGATAAPATPSGRRETRAGWLVSIVSLPLLIALVATGFWGVQLQQRLTAQSAQLVEMQAELTNFGSGTTSYPLSPGVAAPGAEGQIVLGADQRAGMLQIDVNSKDGARSFEMWVNQDGKLVPAAEVTVDQNGIGQARFELDQPFSEYESVHIRAKPIDATVSETAGDTLMRDSQGPLGSTGSGLGFGP
jgi:anti-sigma-K factor RskA